MAGKMGCSGAYNLAGIALFIHGNRSLATKFKKWFDDLRENRTQEVSPDSFDDFFGERYFYFAFGSNMDFSQMKKRCPSSTKIGIGKLRNHSLAFNRTGTKEYSDGVASMIPANNLSVFGIIYSLSKEDIIKLDEEEDKGAYQRTMVKVSLIKYDFDKRESEVELDCYTYFAIPEGYIHYMPSEKYLKKMINAAKKEGLPSSYCQVLEKIQPVEAEN